MSPSVDKVRVSQRLEWEGGGERFLQQENRVGQSGIEHTEKAANEARVPGDAVSMTVLCSEGLCNRSGASYWSLSMPEWPTEGE